MLHPAFFQVPPDIELLPNNTLRVIWYAQIDDLTLVHWEISSGETTLYRPADGTEGESLYQGETLIAWDYYELRSIKVSDPATLAAQSGDPRMRIDSNLGQHGIAPSVVALLRSPQYQVWIGS